MIYYRKTELAGWQTKHLLSELRRSVVNLTSFRDPSLFRFILLQVGRMSWGRFSFSFSKNRPRHIFLVRFTYKKIKLIFYKATFHLWHFFLFLILFVDDKSSFSNLNAMKEYHQFKNHLAFKILSEQIKYLIWSGLVCLIFCKNE